MIKRLTEMRKELIENAFEGKGKIDVVHIADPDESFNKTKFCGIITFEPGSSIGFHRHSPEAELYYVIQGEFEVTENGKTDTLYEGDSMFTGGGDGHSIENKTDRTAILLAIENL